MKIQIAYKNRLLMGFIGVLSVIAVGCEKNGSGMTEVDLSSDLMGGALDAEMGNLIPDYETIDKRLRTARMTGKANPKDVANKHFMDGRPLRPGGSFEAFTIDFAKSPKTEKRNLLGKAVQLIQDFRK